MKKIRKIIEISGITSVLFAYTVLDIRTLQFDNNVSYQDKNSSETIVAREYAYALQSNNVIIDENKEINNENTENIEKTNLNSLDDLLIKNLEVAIKEKEAEIEASRIVYDNMTMTELTEKLNRSLKNELAGYGELYASYSLEKGVDPYLAVAISLHETGCNGKCSNLMKSCNNVSGQKGSPSCGAGSYKRFDTLEDGIKNYIDNLSANYYSRGYNTPETMQSRYAGSTSWAGKVNYYINLIKSR